MTFVKIHGTILDSSVWGEDHSTRIVWLTMLAMADADGIVEASVSGLARRAVVTGPECRAALAIFLGPDEDSRDETTGERIEVVPGGWLVLNHQEYRDRQTTGQIRTAERVRKHRAKKKQSRLQTVTSNDVTPRNDLSPPDAEADTNSDAEVKEHPSELASEPTENAHPHSAPTQPLDPAGTLPPTGKAGAALGASSQASKAVSVAKRKPSKRKPSADAIMIAQRLYQAINAHSPEMFGGDAPADTAKRMLGWTLEIDRGLKASDITVEDALLVVDYAHHIDDPAGSNGFSWHTNLLSGVAMRKQWKKKALLGKARRWRDGKGQGQGALGGKQAASDFIENDDYDYAAAAERNRRMGIGI
jgi:hypothetical protein